MRDGTDRPDGDEAFRTASRWLNALEGNGTLPSGGLQAWLREHPTHLTAFLELTWMDNALAKIPRHARDKPAALIRDATPLMAHLSGTSQDPAALPTKKADTHLPD